LELGRFFTGFIYFLILIWFLNIIINFYLNFNNIFLLLCIWYKIITLIISCSWKFNSSLHLFWKFLNRSLTWFYHIYNVFSFQSHIILIFLKNFFNNHKILVLNLTSVSAWLSYMWIFFDLDPIGFTLFFLGKLYVDVISLFIFSILLIPNLLNDTLTYFIISSFFG
jgi:hypothetical protein